MTTRGKMMIGRRRTVSGGMPITQKYITIRMMELISTLKSSLIRTTIGRISSGKTTFLM